jgi:hypothetical protein
MDENYINTLKFHFEEKIKEAVEHNWQEYKKQLEDIYNDASFPSNFDQIWPLSPQDMDDQDKKDSKL